MTMNVKHIIQDPAILLFSTLPTIIVGEFYEYLDHTADVQLHSWGASLDEAFQNIIPCMFNYMTGVHEDRNKIMMIFFSSYNVHIITHFNPT